MKANTKVAGKAKVRAETTKRVETTYTYQPTTHVAEFQPRHNISGPESQKMLLELSLYGLIKMKKNAQNYRDLKVGKCFWT